VQVVLRRDLLHRFHSLERLKRNPRLELRTVVSSLPFHVSVGFGYTPETLRKLTISLAPFQRATSPGTCRDSGPGPVMLDVRQEYMLHAIAIIESNA